MSSAINRVPHFTQRWAFRLPHERNVSARRPVIAGRIAYVAFSYDRKGLSGSALFAFDVATGVQRWSYTIDHVGNEPVVADGVVYWSSFEGAVYALNEEGRLLWKAPSADASVGVPVLGNENRLFVSEIAGGARYTWCLDRTTGATLWRFAQGGHTYRLFHSDDRLYQASVAPTADNTPPRCSLSCLSATNGTLQWSVSGSEYLFDPVVLDGRVHACSHRKLYIHAADDGRRIGEASLGPERTSVTLAPCSGSDRLIAWGSGGEREGDLLTACTIAPVKRWFGGQRPEVKRLWTVEEPRGLCDAPIALPGGDLAYITHDGFVQLLASATGERLRELKLKTKPDSFGGLAFSGNRLLAAHGRDLILLESDPLQP